MVKDSKSISLEYFRMFIDEDYIYLSGKIGNAVINFVQINKLLKEKDLESELNAILERMFVFEFDKLVSVEDDEPYEEESER